MKIKWNAIGAVATVVIATVAVANLVHDRLSSPPDVVPAGIGDDVAVDEPARDAGRAQGERLTLNRPWLPSRALRQVIVDAVADIYWRPVASITDDLRFDGPELADPTASTTAAARFVELVIAVEGIADCRLPDTVFGAVETVADLIAFATPRCSIDGGTGAAPAGGG